MDDADDAMLPPLDLRGAGARVAAWYGETADVSDAADDDDVASDADDDVAEARFATRYDDFGTTNADEGGFVVGAAGA